MKMRTIKNPPFKKPKWLREYVKAGDKVLIHNYSKELNGKTGRVTWRDGDYIYVKPHYQRYEVELLPCEVTKII